MTAIDTRDTIVSSAVTCANLGLQRIDFVRLIVHERGTSAEVVGASRHELRTVRVAMATAVDLIEAGVPKRVVARPMSSHLAGTVERG